MLQFQQLVIDDIKVLSGFGQNKPQINLLILLQFTTCLTGWQS